MIIINDPSYHWQGWHGRGVNNHGLHHDMLRLPNLMLLHLSVVVNIPLYAALCWLVTQKGNNGCNDGYLLIGYSSQDPTLHSSLFTSNIIRKCWRWGMLWWLFVEELSWLYCYPSTTFLLVPQVLARQVHRINCLRTSITLCSGPKPCLKS